jgi:hypothetical protein
MLSEARNMLRASAVAQERTGADSRRRAGVTPDGREGRLERVAGKRGAQEERGEGAAFSSSRRRLCSARGLVGGGGRALTPGNGCA